MIATTTPAARAIYLPWEAASYLRASLPAQTRSPTSAQVYGWIRRGLLAPTFRGAPDASIVVDFDDLVTAQAIVLMRRAGLALSRIAQAESYFAGLYGVARPFAHRCFWTSGPDLFGEVEGAGEPASVLVTGTRGGQIALPFMGERSSPVPTHLGFDDTTGRPISWRPAHGIELRPQVQSGQPCVSGTWVTTSAIDRYVRSGVRPALLAQRYRIEEADVQAAVDWEHSRARRPASRRPDERC